MTAAQRRRGRAAGTGLDLVRAERASWRERSLDAGRAERAGGPEGAADSPWTW
ncbi:hypothetical protein AB0C10_13795 [Microbispora amethystogenes]|uniref:hypothetical protein n=1 Tax=Microbispora amethystogenes TaxID=1427754 RepID=UPI0033FB1E0D